MFPQFEGMHSISTFGVWITTASMLIMLYSWLHGMFAGKKAEANPWGSQSLEFTHTEVIPGPGNFPTPPVMPEGWSPYNYATTK